MSVETNRVTCACGVSLSVWTQDTRSAAYAGLRVEIDHNGDLGPRCNDSLRTVLSGAASTLGARVGRG